MKDLLKYGLIASAGQPRSLTGEALIGLGALLSQMDFKLSKDEEKSDDIEITDEPTEEYLKYKIFGDVDQKAEDKKVQKKYDDAMAFDPNSVQVEDPFQYDKSDFGIMTPSEQVVQDSNNDGSEDTFINLEEIKQEARDRVIKDTTGRGTSSISSMGLNTESQKFDEFLQQLDSSDKKNFDAQSVMDIINQQALIDKTFGKKTSTFNRLKPEVLQILDSARYKNKGKDDTPLHRVAHVTNSPYLRTDDVDYRQMRQATAPGYTGEIGKAAIEGYNLVIDKYNYDQAVKADYEEELEDQMGSLNVEADFLTDQARQDYLELSMGKKKRLNEAFNSYANGDISKLDYENVKANLASELQAAAATRTNITNSIKDFIENKGTIDKEASDPEMLDFLMTGEKSPEKISIKNIDGVDYVTGTTRGGRDFQVPTSKIANGTAGFRVVKKASLAPVISGALKNINAYTSTVKTDLGFGVSTPNPEKARNIGIASIRTNLGSNEADLRSIMSQIYGVNHTAYQNFLGSDPTANKSAMLDDAAEYLYDTQVAEKYFPMTKTTRFTTGKKSSSTQGERDRAEIKSKLDNLPSPTTTNIDNYMTLLKLNKGEAYQVKDNKLIIGDVKAGTALRTIDLSNPTLAKSQIANLAGVLGYGQGEGLQDLSQYNFDL
tara:strand:- start:732 stop:2714 length:1983 start_codon:yes stop_codon:yes gene_type:complete